MAFPINPTNGQQTDVNGIQYTFSSAENAWLVTSSGGAITFAESLTISGNITGDYFVGDGSSLTNLPSILSNGTSQLGVTGVDGSIVGEVASSRVLNLSSTGLGIGMSSGLIFQGTNAISIGYSAGLRNQGSEAIAIGTGAGYWYQGQNSISIGGDDGAESNQAANSISIGYNAGTGSQGASAIAIGYNAGNGNQGINSIAIGANSGVSLQSANSIVINATGSNLSGIAEGTYIAPIRNDTENVSNIITYNTSSGELTYTDTISLTGNITGSYLLGNGSQLTGLPAGYSNADVATYLASGNVSTDITTTGSLGVGTAASGTAGEIRATNNITAYYSSDRKFKENIRPIPDALARCIAIGGKLYDWTDEYIESKGGIDDYFMTKEDLGVIAQDVQQNAPQIVRTRPDGSLAVSYERLSALALAGISEVASVIESLETHVAQLTAHVNQLTDEIERLKNQ